jgi:hypothetical protein
VVGQDEPEAIDLSAVVPVTGTVDACQVTRSATDLSEPGIQRRRDLGLVCRVEVSDPRMSGVSSVVWNGDSYDATGVFVYWGTMRGEGPDGAWDCSFTATGNPFPATAVDELGLIVCSGTDGYAGLTFVGYQGTDGEEGFGDGINVVGFIYPGDPPPPWGPPVE